MQERNEVLEGRLLKAMERLSDALEPHGNIFRGMLRETVDTGEEPKSSQMKPG